MVSSFFYFINQFLQTTEVIWAPWNSIHVLNTLIKCRVESGWFTETMQTGITHNTYNTICTYTFVYGETFSSHIYVPFPSANDRVSILSKLGPASTTSCRNYLKVLACGSSYLFPKKIILSDVYQQKDYTHFIKEIVC